MSDSLRRGLSVRISPTEVDGSLIDISAFLILRVGAIFYLKYSKEQLPLEAFTWSFPLRYIAWALTLDYLFYWWVQLSNHH